MRDIVSSLEEIVQDLMSVDVVPVRERTSENCSHWDSMFNLNLLLSIEEEFGLQISDKEALELTSFQTAVRMIEKKCRASGE